MNPKKYNTWFINFLVRKCVYNKSNPFPQTFLKHIYLNSTNVAYIQELHGEELVGLLISIKPIICFFSTQACGWETGLSPCSTLKLTSHALLSLGTIALPQTYGADQDSTS